MSEDYSTNEQRLNELAEENEFLILREKKYKSALAQANESYKLLVGKVVAFASEIQSWGNEAAASEILTEVLGGEVIAPNYNQLRATIRKIAEVAKNGAPEFSYGGISDSGKVVDALDEIIDLCNEVEHE